MEGVITPGVAHNAETRAVPTAALALIREGMVDGEIWTTKPINRALVKVLDYFHALCIDGTLDA